ncbi:MAG: hypothetical protein KKA60_02290 [Proteobacteria bacterium]|nr:hypothetical protein [Pseudomonadota bacterium]
MAPKEEDGGEIACCGPPAGPRSGANEKPGYLVWPFVEEFVQTPAGDTPRVRTRLSLLDRFLAAGARLGIARNSHKVAPGLYTLGLPGPESPVLVTANYKLSFDAVRSSMEGRSAWLLVVDTRGINVWCAAGKGSFSADEVTRQVVRTRLDLAVSHRTLILPQLSAPGVAARKVRRATGFTVQWGPIRAGDLPRYLDQGNKADPAMRQVSFTLGERVVLLPVEISMVLKPVALVILAGFLVSGIGHGGYSLAAAWHRGWVFATGILLAILAGAAVTPLALPRLPFTAFSAKGAVVGAVMGATYALYVSGGWMAGWALVLLMAAFSSYLAMNFTGATPFTSGSGVEKEMRRAIPFQTLAVLGGAVAWIAGGFV